MVQPPEKSPAACRARPSATSEAIQTKRRIGMRERTEEAEGSVVERIVPLRA